MDNIGGGENGSCKVRLKGANVCAAWLALFLLVFVLNHHSLHLSDICISQLEYLSSSDAS